ncbi:MAG: putative DNA binding domain-containing protein [Verrucomicrobia bacterium]|jgi:ATP-dependent DNA helicase RecG|nr:putative DNA binding domain-containing protein [Verrucomicrobiota bacterium]OQC63532.1 MAG: Divergent AAA domain protein [Verrucomicrobia bacterium ADurb.Bin006]MDI9381365.1 ATP-binding protein [Verrucomicrobiota bacterium]HOA62695.1 ATP-binding protein [Verrucomicrobiota bacterium]HOF49585.1 ATP-binding protein [Verrucomicrobiota bacterium]
MTPDALRTLIGGGETLTVEFKGEEHTPLGDRDLVEAIVCLVNRIGDTPAHLLIGVEDDGRITGARLRHGETPDPARIATLIANRTRPSVAVRAECVTIDGKPVLVVEVPAQRQPVATSEGLFLRRALGGDGRPACVPMDGYAVQSLQSSRGLLDPSAQIVAEAHWEHLDPLEFERFRRSVRERRGRSDESLIDLPDLDLAKALGVVDANGSVRGVRLAALLLFAKEDALRRFMPAHEVAFQVLRGLDVEVNDFFRWPLLRVMEECEARIRARNREQELMVGLLRVGVPDYPERALREALANALIHRDYQRLGAVHFQWQTDQIEITSPGGFPEGMRLDNLLVTAPRPRNPLLADAFKRAGIVERTARGIDTIFFEQLRNGRPAPSYERSNEATVSVVVPGGAANLDFVRLLVTEAQQGRALTLDELLILNALWQTRSVTTDDAARLVQKPEAETRAALHRLVEAGLVEERGQKRGRNWHLSAATYRLLGDKAGYVRQRGFEPLQQEQMVLQYVEKHGRITRREAAELCRLSPDQAYRLLTRLKDEGRLARHGSKKGAWYEGRA